MKKLSEVIIKAIAEMVMWIEQDAKECDCGGRMIRDDAIAFTSNPPKFQWTCIECGKSELREEGK
jgi:hypothetical protein